MPIPFTIIRPTLIVGQADVLTNNIAWLLRRFPIFLIPGNSDFRLQPVTLGDTARIISDAVEHQDNSEMDAAGPDIMSFAEYVGLVAKACHLKRPMIHVPEGLSLGFLRVIQPLLQDIILTREELLGLKQELLTSKKPPLGKEPVAKWLERYGDQLGRQYINDIDRHFARGRTKAVLYIDKAGNLRPVY